MAVTADPMVSADDLVILFTGAPDTTTIAHLFYAARATPTEPFSGVQMIPDVSSTMLDGDPFAAADGCELFFSSDRTGNRELFMATAQ